MTLNKVELGVVKYGCEFIHTIEESEVEVKFQERKCVSFSSIKEAELYVHKEIYCEQKISPQRIITEGVSCIIAMYVYSEVCASEFADYLAANLEEHFSKPLDIATIMGAIQQFRAWDFDSGTAEEENIYQIDATVNMIDSGANYLENEYTDYVYSDGSFVPNDTRIGIQIGGSIELDYGISISKIVRIELKAS